YKYNGGSPKSTINIIHWEGTLSAQKIVTVHLPQELHRRFKLKTVQEDTSMTAVILQFITEWTNEASPSTEQPEEAIQLPSRPMRFA
ncbi:unnamed protein product, partial [marine sediment metagenome]